MPKTIKRALLGAPSILLILLGSAGMQAAEEQYYLIPGDGVSNRVKDVVREIAGKCISFFCESMNMRVDRTIKIYVYRGEMAYKQGLLDILHLDPREAASVASNSAACASGINILINGQTIKIVTPEVWQVTVICHELAHIFQHLCSTDQRTWHAWIVEGHARLMAALAVEKIGLKPFAEFSQECRGDFAGGAPYPPLADLVTGDQITSAFDKYAYDLMNSYLFFAVDVLLSETSHPAFARYFRATGPDDAEAPTSREENFRLAFGFGVEDYQRDLDRRLKEISAQRK